MLLDVEFSDKIGDYLYLKVFCFFLLQLEPFPKHVRNLPTLHPRQYSSGRSDTAAVLADNSNDERV